MILMMSVSYNNVNFVIQSKKVSLFTRKTGVKTCTKNQTENGALNLTGHTALKPTSATGLLCSLLTVRTQSQAQAELLYTNRVPPAMIIATSKHTGLNYK